MSKIVLPADVLGDIFISIIVDSHSALPRYLTPAAATRTTLCLSSVDTYWRTVALSTPRVWSYLNMAFVGGAWRPHPDLVALFLARAQHVPLNLQIVARHMLTQESASAWDTLAEQLMAAAGVLHVIAMNDSASTTYLVRAESLARILTKPSPRLTCLKYRFLHHTAIGDLEDARGRMLPHAPQIVELQLDNFGASLLMVFLPSAVRGLKRLAWRMAGWPLNVADVLDAAPELQGLEVAYDTVNMNSSAASHNHIAHALVSLRGNVNGIVAQIDRKRAPNVETMQFSDKFKFDATSLARFFDFAPYTALRHLVLPPPDDSDPIMMATAIELFKYMPGIRTLSLPLLLEKGGYLTEWARSENVRLLPNLQKITFRSLAFDRSPMVEQLNDPPVFKFLRGRRTAMPEMCEGDGVLSLVLEVEAKECNPVVEGICDLLGTHVATIRVVGSINHKIPGTVILEVRDGLRRVGPT